MQLMFILYNNEHPILTSFQPSLLRPALSYLDAASQKDQSVYNYAMLYHVFRVSGNVERANAMRKKLKTLAIDEGMKTNKSFYGQTHTLYICPKIKVDSI